MILFCYWERGQVRGKHGRVKKSQGLQLRTLAPFYRIALVFVRVLVSLSAVGVAVVVAVVISVVISVVCSVVRSVLH